MYLTREQREALKRIYDCGIAERPVFAKQFPSYLAYRRTAEMLLDLAYRHGGCVLVPWQGMWLGIEPDGYASGLQFEAVEEGRKL